MTEEKKERTRQARDAEKRCQVFIQKLLQYGGQPPKSVKLECQEAGFSLRTTERAVQKLGVVAKRDYGMYFWTLPKEGEPTSG